MKTEPLSPRTLPRTFERNLLVLLLVSFPTGCVSYSARPFLDQRTAASLLEHRVAEGLHVALVDISTPRRSLKHFDRKLTSYGFVPVMIYLELDVTSSDAFNVRREDIRLCLRDGTRLHAADPMDVVDSVSYSHLRSALGFFMVLPGFFVAKSVNRANEELENDYLQKALRSVRISQNLRSYKGVVFFQLPEELWGDFTMEDAFLEMTAHREGQERGAMGRPIQFPVHFSR